MTVAVARGASIPAGPLVAWLREQRAELRADPIHASRPVTVLSERLGITTRTLRRYLQSHDAQDQPVDTYHRNIVEDMLDRAGVLLEELYPDLAEALELEPEAWCSSCGQFVVPLSGACPWCGLQTGPRRRGQHGPIGQRVTDDQLRALHSLHVRYRMPVMDLARPAYERLGYKTPASAAWAIDHGWKRLALPKLSRSEVMAAWHQRNEPPAALPDDAMEEAERLHVEEGLTPHVIADRLLERSHITHAKHLARRLILEFRARGIYEPLTLRQREIVRLAGRPRGITSTQAGIVMSGRENLTALERGYAQREGWNALRRLADRGYVHQPKLRGAWFAVEDDELEQDEAA